MIDNQLTLGVGLNDYATFDNFFAGQNLHLIELLKTAASGKGDSFICFYGLGGEGCTHLLHACCHYANRFSLRSVYLPLDNLSDLKPDIFEGLENLDLICIDDIQTIVGQPKWEEAFFHAYNKIHDATKQLIVSANKPPKLLNTLPDIISRLTSGIVYQLQPLSDDEKLQALINRADRRGMTLYEEVGRFILKNCPRHMSTLFAALDALDKASLSAQRKLTIPFVKQVLQI